MQFLVIICYKTICALFNHKVTLLIIMNKHSFNASILVYPQMH